MLYDLLIAPFGGDFPFMRRALVACLALALGYGPVGTFLVIRRMALVSDAMAHAILPGAAIGFLVSGLSLWAMGIGGLIAGLIVAVLAGLVSRLTPLREDASFAALYLISLALGVTIIALRGSSVDLIHVLFGSVLAVDDDALYLMAGTATLTLAALLAMLRPLVLETLDPKFLAALGGGGALWHIGFLALVAVNTVAGFQALGTLMAVGLMVLPAVAARFWSRQILPLVALSSLLALLSGYLGLLASFHLDLPSGPAIVLTAALLYVGSMMLGRHDSVRARLTRPAHLRN